ncbi:MAG TPA: iron ABC transporter substrate-binding protein [Ruminococcaceae bacterium]|nr:iron ABC transporter substrate-binding protein [Oscillospiraceae bacterium]
MKKFLALLLASCVLLTFASCGGKTETDTTTKPAGEMTPEDYTGTLTVYSPHDSDPLNAGVALFEAKYPNVTVEVIADGTSNLVAKIAAESANPVCDVIWGGGADTLAAYKDYFQPYKPMCFDKLDASLCDSEYYWIGESPLPMTFVVNTQKVAEEDIPESWADLLNWDVAKYGKIAIADPASSGSAFTQLCTMLSVFGTSADNYQSGWDFVKALYPKLEVKSSSSLAHKDVFAGENAMGITLEKGSVAYEEDWMVTVYPSDGTSAVPDGVAIIKDCPNPELAKLFEEFVLSSECQTAQNKDWARRPMRSDVEATGLKTLSDIKLINYDFDYVSANASSIKEQWQDIVVG